MQKNNIIEFLDPENIEPAELYFRKGYEKKMENSLYIPSVSHAYSLGVEFMRDWLLKRFPKNFFKTVFVNGRNVHIDYKKFSFMDSLKKEKPAMAILPTPDMEYDNNYQDKYIGGPNMMLNKYNHQIEFFKDFENNIIMQLCTRTQRIPFTIGFRFETRAQQLDMYRHIEYYCRVGFTNTEYHDCDFHIPYEIIINIAKHAEFEVITKKDDKGKVISEYIDDVISFLHYMNMHSKFPICYKLRSASGRNEFFMRVPNIWFHIDTMDNLNYDDGEREGQTENNFKINMNCTLSYWVPAFYIYKSTKPIYSCIKTADSATVGLWTYKILEVPDHNDQGWELKFKSDYELDEEEIENKKCEIDLSFIFSNKKTYITDLIQKYIKMGLSPSRFIDIQIMDISESTVCSMDWENNKLIIDNIEKEKIYLAVYIDISYINEERIIEENIKKTRLN